MCKAIDDMIADATNEANQKIALLSSQNTALSSQNAVLKTENASLTRLAHSLYLNCFEAKNQTFVYCIPSIHDLSSFHKQFPSFLCAVQFYGHIFSFQEFLLIH